MRWIILGLGLCWLVLPSAVPLADDPVPDTRERKIRDALRGDHDASSSDPLLDGVLDVIREQGSILEGSLWDESLRKDSPEEGTDIDISDADARLAESLLRTARLLNSHHSAKGSKRIRQLVIRLRAQAVLVLSGR